MLLKNQYDNESKDKTINQYSQFICRTKKEYPKLWKTKFKQVLQNYQ